MFVVLAAAIVLVDQALKAWVVSNFRTNEPVQVLGDLLRVDFIHNSGGLFGIFQNSVPAFALMSIVVVIFIAALQVRSGWRSWPVTFALTLLLGGAIGNFIDRVRLGYVVDFADMGVGPWRWYIFNLADSAVTVAIVLLLVMSFLAPAALSLSDPRDEAVEAAEGPDAAAAEAAEGADAADARKVVPAASSPDAGDGPPESGSADAAPIGRDESAAVAPAGGEPGPGRR